MKLNNKMISIKNDNFFLVLRFPFLYTEKADIFGSIYSTNSIEICYNKKTKKLHFQFLGKKNERITGFFPKKNILENMIFIAKTYKVSNELILQLEKLKEQYEKRNLYNGEKWNRKEHYY